MSACSSSNSPGTHLAPNHSTSTGYSSNHGSTFFNCPIQFSNSSFTASIVSFGATPHLPSKINESGTELGQLPPSIFPTLIGTGIGISLYNGSVIPVPINVGKIEGGSWPSSVP